MTQNPSTCPHCGNDRLYQLSDGRFKCSACRKKFSLSGRRARLPTEAMDAIVSGFASGTPTSAVAAETGVNPKTVQLYYGRIRELLATERESYLAECYGSAEVSPALFFDSAVSAQWSNAVFVGCLIDQESEVELLLTAEKEGVDTAGPNSSSIDGWLVAADRKALDSLQIDRFFCLSGTGAKGRVRSFWLSAKQRLSAYCGGFRKHFRLYLREMEFRNNTDSPAAAREHIEMLLDKNNNPPTGEEDA